MRAYHELEMLRGQVEELTGRLERLGTQICEPQDAPSWLRAQLRGGSRELRGKSRRMMASTRMMADDASHWLPGWSTFRTIYLIGGGLILGAAALAYFAPSAFDWVRNQFSSFYGTTDEDFEMEETIGEVTVCETDVVATPVGMSYREMPPQRGF